MSKKISLFNKLKNLDKSVRTVLLISSDSSSSKCYSTWSSSFRMWLLDSLLMNLHPSKPQNRSITSCLECHCWHLENQKMPLLRNKMWKWSDLTRFCLNFQFICWEKEFNILNMPTRNLYLKIFLLITRPCLIQAPSWSWEIRIWTKKRQQNWGWHWLQVTKLRKNSSILKGKLEVLRPLLTLFN